MIIVVDIFEEEEDERDSGKSYKTYQGRRIKFHLQQWNTTALDAAFGLLTKEQLKFVCLFINKIDKWTEAGDAQSSDQIKREFDPLISELTKRTSGYAKFSVIIGSAKRGDNVVGQDGLLPKLSQYSVPQE